MKPIELLHATEQAIESGELFEQHQALIEEAKQLQDHKAVGALCCGMLCGAVGYWSGAIAFYWCCKTKEC